MNKQSYEHIVGITSRTRLSKRANPILDDLTQQGSLDPNKSYGYLTPHTQVPQAPAKPRTPASPQTPPPIKPKFTAQDEPYNVKGDIFGKWEYYNKNNPLYQELVPKYNLVNETYKGRTSPYGPKAMQTQKDMTQHVPTQKMWDFMNYDYALRRRLREIGYPDSTYRLRRLVYGPYDPDYQYDTKIRPAALINARTGDPNYINKTFDEVTGYLKGNPDWTQKPDGSWHNQKYGLTYDLNRWKRQANTPATVRFNEGRTVSGFYAKPHDEDKNMKYHWEDIMEQIKDAAEIYTKHPNKAVKLGMPRTFDEYVNKVLNENINNPERIRSNGINVGMTPYKLNPDHIMSAEIRRMYTDSSTIEDIARTPEHEQIASTTGHELNHFAQNGTLSRAKDKSPAEDKDYATDLEELAQAGAVFQQQLYRLTGKRITRPYELESGIRYALEHIEDFDPESRRFIDHALSLMRDDANTKHKLRRRYKNYIKRYPDNFLQIKDIDDYNSRYPSRSYGELYDQLKALMPLLGDNRNNTYSSTVPA